MLNFILRRQVRIRTETLKSTISAKEKIESELKVAHEIQMDLLPRSFPAFPGRNDFDIYAVIKPAREVGGDFYDFFLIDDNHLCVVIGDVSDKGVPAALFMARAKTLIKSTARNTHSPSSIMDFANRHLSEDNDALMFATAFCAVLTIDSGELVYSNAGHNSPIIASVNREAFFLEPTGSTALGIDSDSLFPELTTNLDPEEILLLYTDGVTEELNQRGEVFSEELLLKLVAENPTIPVKDMVTSILDSVSGHKADTDQSDDIAILGLKLLS